MATCKKRPRITTLAVTAGGLPERLTFPTSTAAFLIRPRTAVGVTIRLDPASSDYFSLGAGETYAEEDLRLEDALALWIDAASDVVVEVWSWDG